jgi:two-component system cell cycle response regulator DivK
MTQALIVIVEDNQHNMKLVRDVLGHVGYRTLEAGDAELGIDLARTHRPDLILMDVQLSGMNGMEALARLRSDPATEELRVVAVTAFAMKEDRARILAAGFDGYLEKPLDVRAFPAQVSELLSAFPAWRHDGQPGDPGRGRPAREHPAAAGVLEPRGYIVVTAMSGAEALEQVASQPIDMVLLDVSMPGMDGFEVCGRLQAEPATTFLPVVMVTASGSEEKVAGIKAGATTSAQAVRSRRVAGAGAVAASHQGVPRHDLRAGRTAGRVERPVRAAGGAAGRPAGAGGPAEVVPVAAAGGHDRVLG